MKTGGAVGSGYIGVSSQEKGLEYVLCDLCGGDEAQVLFQGQDTLDLDPTVFSIVQCQRCGLAYLNPRPTQRALSAYYSANYFKSFSSGSLSSLRVRRLFKQFYGVLIGGLARKVEALPPGRVLDVGCGDGRYLDLFRARGWETCGVDPTAVAIERARSLGLHVFRGELTAADLPGSYFDLVVMRYTLENMHNPSEVLREVRRVLKDDGCLFLAVPTIDSPAARLFKGYSAYVDVPRHLYFFTAATLTRMLERAGFRVERLAAVPSWFARDVLNRMSRGRLKSVLGTRWISRLLWMAELPTSLLLAYVGLNRGNLEIVARKNEATQSRNLIGENNLPKRGLRWQAFGYLARVLPTRAHYLYKELSGCQTVLDLGCGSSSPVQYRQVEYAVGVDVCREYLEEARRRRTHAAYVLADVRGIEFRAQSFDAVVLADVIEHMSKEEGCAVLRKAERLARQKVVVLTPNGFMPVEAEDKDQNPLDAHVCGWEPGEFRPLGYEVHGLLGLKAFWRTHKGPAPMRWVWKAILYGVVQPFAYQRPEYAHDLMAVKRVRRHT